MAVRATETGGYVGGPLLAEEEDNRFWMIYDPCFTLALPKVRWHDKADALRVAQKLLAKGTCERVFLLEAAAEVTLAGPPITVKELR